MHLPIEPLVSCIFLLVFNQCWGFNLPSSSFWPRNVCRSKALLAAKRRQITGSCKRIERKITPIWQAQPSFGKDKHVFLSRRRITFQSVATAFNLGALFWGSNWKNNEARAVVMDTSSKEARTFIAGEKLGKAASMDRLNKARQDLNYLQQNFDDIVTSGGGDNVRRYLGTVGVTSGLYGITKVLKELQEEADDIVMYTENMNDFDYFLRAADTACYSANFVEFSAAKTKPEKFFEDAKSDVQNMKTALDRMTEELAAK